MKRSASHWGPYGPKIEHLSAPNHKSQIASDLKSQSPNRKNFPQIAALGSSNRTFKSRDLWFEPLFKSPLESQCQFLIQQLRKMSFSEKVHTVSIKSLVICDSRFESQIAIAVKSRDLVHLVEHTSFTRTFRAPGYPAKKSQRAKRLKKDNLAWNVQSRLKTSILFENDESWPSEFPRSWSFRFLGP